MKRLLFLVPATLVVAALAFLSRGSTPTQAAGACNPATAGITAAENDFKTQLQQWRAANVGATTQLQFSASLSRAAAVWAEDVLAHGPGVDGHHDAAGRDWVQRAQDCGFTGVSLFYPPIAGGEGIALTSGSPAAAISYMASHSGSGIYTPDAIGPQARAKCVGVAGVPESSPVVWVMVIAYWQTGGNCPEPQSVTSGALSPSPSPSPSRSSTPSPSPSSSPSPAATPSPATTPALPPPVIRRALIGAISRDGN